MSDNACELTVGDPEDLPVTPPPDPPKKPYPNIDWRAALAEVIVIGLIQPFIQPFFDLIMSIDDTGVAEDWLNGFVNGMIRFVRAALWPMEAAINALSEAMGSEVSKSTWNDYFQRIGQLITIVEAVLKLLFGIPEITVIGGEEYLAAPNGFAFGTVSGAGDILGNGMIFIPPSEANNFIKRAEQQNGVMGWLKAGLSAALMTLLGWALSPAVKALTKLIGMTPLLTKVTGGISGTVAAYIFDKLIEGKTGERIAQMKFCAQKGSGFVLTKNEVNEWSPTAEGKYGKYPYIKLSKLR